MVLWLAAETAILGRRQQHVDREVSTLIAMPSARATRRRRDRGVFIDAGRGRTRV